MDRHTAKGKGELEQKQIRLFKGDAAFIDEHFPRAGHTIVIRNLVRKFCKSIEEKINKIEETKEELPNVPTNRSK